MFTCYSNGTLFSYSNSSAAFYRRVIKIKKKFSQYGFTMLIIAVLQAIAVFAIMMPVFVVISLENFPLAISTGTNFLGKLGLIAGILDVWIVASWRLRSLLQYYAHKRMLILLTLNLGSAALVIGVLGLPAFTWHFCHAVKEKFQKSKLISILCLYICLPRGTCSCLNLN